MWLQRHLSRCGVGSCGNWGASGRRHQSPGAHNSWEWPPRTSPAAEGARAGQISKSCMARKSILADPNARPSRSHGKPAGSMGQTEALLFPSDRLASYTTRVSAHPEERSRQKQRRKNGLRHASHVESHRQPQKRTRLTGITDEARVHEHTKTGIRRATPPTRERRW